MRHTNEARLRRARQTRIRIRQQDAIRLTVHRTNSHIYAQITTARGDRVLAAASTLEKDVRATLKTLESASPRRRRQPASRRSRSTAPGTATRAA